jgi:hypothetical protein
MTNLIPANMQVPAHLAGRIGTPSALAQSLVGGLSSGESIPRISIKGARFRIVDGDTETVMESTSLFAVIVGANPRLSKTWYAKAWDKDAEPAAPDCYSLDGVGPDPAATSPQHDLCASCPRNAWGSKVTDSGQQLKECSDKKRLAVVASDDPSGPVYLLEVTPAALKGLNQYQKELSTRGIPPEIVRTKISFDTNASFPKLQFGFGGFLEADDQAIVDTLFGTDQVKDITGENIRMIAKPAAAPKPMLVKAAPAPKPEPEPEPEETPEPKRGFGSSKVVSEPAPVRVKAEPKAAAVATEAAAMSLADEIAALVGEADADDA